MKKILLSIITIMLLTLTACTDKQISNDGYSVVFYTGLEATQIPALLNVQSGSKIEAPVDPVVPGKDFDGWFTTIDAQEGTEWDFDSSVVMSSITLYARWIDGIYSLEFIPDGGQLLSGSYPTEYKNGQRVVFPLVSKRGYTFNGWYLVPPQEIKPGQASISSTEGQRGDLVLYAKFTAITVQVVFRIGLEGEPQPAASAVKLPATQNMTFGNIVNFKDPEFIGTPTHRFLGWFRENGEQIVNGTPFDRISRTTLYAKWEEIK